VALAIGQKRRQGRALHAGDAAQAEHAAGQHSAGGASGHKTVHLLLLQLQHADHGGGVLLAAHTHHRALMVGDDLRGIHQADAAADVVAVLEQGFHLAQVASQHHFDIVITAERLDGTLHRSLRSEVAAHGVHKNTHGYSSLVKQRSFYSIKK